MSAPVTLAGQQCLSPATLRRQCLDLGLATDWYGKPNSYHCPLGPEPGRGWVLLTRGQLDAIDLQNRYGGLYDLAFALTPEASTGPAGTVTVKALVVTSVEQLTPGQDGDRSAAYLVGLADRRHVYRRLPVDAAYNVRHVLTEAYIQGTVKSWTPGSPGLGGQPLIVPWTWDQVVKDLWTQVGTLGTYPGLPAGFTPDGTPEDLEYWETPGLDALADVLRRLGCDLAYNPLLATFTIVQVGATDRAATDAFARWARWRHWDDLPLAAVRARIPQYVRVLFRKLPHVRAVDGSPWYSIDVTDPTGNSAAGGFEPGTRVLLHDDLHALYAGSGAGGNGTAPTNPNALTARANQRAADWYRRAWLLVAGLRRVYPLALGDAGLLPGAQVRSVRWADTAGPRLPGRGLVTEVELHGEVPGQDYAPVTIDPLTEVIRVNSQTPVGGAFLFDATISPSGSVDWHDGVAVWARTLHTSATIPSSVDHFIGRLVDFENGRNVYAFDEGPIVIGSNPGNGDPVNPLAAATCGTLYLDLNSGFSYSQGTPNPIVTVSLQAASATHAGAASYLPFPGNNPAFPTFQVLGRGVKVFYEGILLAPQSQPDGWYLYSNPDINTPGRYMNVLGIWPNTTYGGPGGNPFFPYSFLDPLLAPFAFVADNTSGGPFGPVNYYLRVNNQNGATTSSGPFYSVNVLGGIVYGGSTTPAPAPPTGTASGDLVGSYPGPNVAGLQGHAVKNAAPTDAQVLLWNNGNADWEPVSVSGDATVTDTGAVTVTALRGHAVKNATPTDAQLLVWVNANSDWEPVSLSGDATVTAAGVVALKSGLHLQGQVQSDAHWGALHTDTDGATITFDLSVANEHTVTLGGNRTLATSNDQNGQAFLIVLVQDGTGSRTVTWWSGILWPGGTVPTLTTTANKADVFSFIRTASGAYYGFVVGQNL